MVIAIHGKGLQRELIAVFLNAFFSKHFGIISQFTRQMFLILSYGSQSA